MKITLVCALWLSARGVVHAWVGQILLNCDVFKRNSSVPLRAEGQIHRVLGRSYP